MMRSGNPALSAKTFTQAAAGDGTMTVQGTVNKTGLLLGILTVVSFLVWNKAAFFVPTMLLWILLGFAAALMTIFKKTWAPVTAPIYAALEGVVIGTLSAWFEMQFPGIVIQAVMLTFGVMAALLMAYSSGLIRVTQNFRLGIVAATGGICLIYLASILLGFFGIQIPMIHEAGPIGIGFSLVVVTIAALNLVLDFDFIEQAAGTGQPKYMEWYGAFGLVVTLVWLYLEILRLLAKLNSRR